MKCQLCSREASTDLCGNHDVARAAVESTFPRWVKAYGTLGRKEYLERLSKNPETGQWAKEVAELLLSREKGQTQSKPPA